MKTPAGARNANATLREREDKLGLMWNPMWNQIRNPNGGLPHKSAMNLLIVLAVIFLINVGARLSVLFVCRFSTKIKSTH